MTISPVAGTAEIDVNEIHRGNAPKEGLDACSMDVRTNFYVLLVVRSIISAHCTAMLDGLSATEADRG